MLLVDHFDECRNTSSLHTETSAVTTQTEKSAARNTSRTGRQKRTAVRLTIASSLIAMLTSLGLVLAASPAMAYGYTFEYRIATTTRSANEVYSFVNSHFDTVFPSPGNCGKSLYVGKRCDLVGKGLGNIEVVEVGSRHFAFKSRPGHFEGANKRVNFTLENRGRDLYLVVTGSGKDNW